MPTTEIHPEHRRNADLHSERQSEPQRVWRTLYERRMPQLARSGSSVYLDGLRAVQISADCMPVLEDINRQLAPLTGWRAVPAAGFLPPADFFASLARREFPTVTRLREWDELDYTPEPDIFHDVFGHVPMHANPVFADFLQAFGEAASHAQTDLERLRMTRLFWFTVEFGLIHEHGQVKVYGSGLISSHAECAHALGDNCRRERFNLFPVLNQPFRHDEIQPVLFVVDSFTELFDAVNDASSMLARGALDADLARA